MKKHLAFFISVIMLITVLGGCGPAKGGNRSGTGTDAGKGPLDASYQQYVSDAKTGYFVISGNDEHTYLKENHPLVREVGTVVKGFCRDLIERDYRNDDGKKEYKWYTKNIVEQLVNKKDPEKTLADLKKYEIVQKENGTSVAGIIFTDSGKAAQVAFETKTYWESGSPEFLSKNKVKLNIAYTIQGVALLTREDGHWKVAGSRLNTPKLGN